MEIFIIGVVLVISFFLGTFGFSQIVGTLKYFRNFSIGSALFTIIFWTAILGFGAFAVIAWLNDYAVGLYIGYGISFILSFRTKPD